MNIFSTWGQIKKDSKTLQLMLYRLSRHHFATCHKISGTLKVVGYKINAVCSQQHCWQSTWALSHYPKRRLSVRPRKVSKPRDLYLKFFYRSEIWPALRQQCCRCACQISKRYDNLKYHSRGLETLRDLTKRRLFGYWGGALLYASRILIVLPNDQKPGLFE